VARVNGLPTDLTLAVTRLFGEKSQLKAAIPEFISRAPQQTLAAEVANAIQHQLTLVAEAGTGTGKTFAYLVPSLLSGKKIIVSTATKMLQDQLVSKDLPLLMRALGIGLRVQNLKGRANYLCEYRIKTLSEETRFVERQTAVSLQRIREKLSQLKEGVREELPELTEQDPVWPYATSTSENCLGGECPHLQTCFLAKARRRALDADLVVINHHLFFADAKLKTEGFGSLLPGVEVMIFDEAHQLPETASDFYATRFSTRMLSDWQNDVTRAWPLACPINHEIQQCNLMLGQAIEAIKTYCLEKSRFRFQSLYQEETFRTAWTQLHDKLSNYVPHFESCDWLEDEAYPEIKPLFDRLNAQINLIQAFTPLPEGKEKGHIAWGETFKHHVVFYLTPVDIAPLFQASLFQEQKTCIFTSATLSVADSFAVFIERLGLRQPKTLLLPSPFDFATQALLYLPRGLPDSKHTHYYERLLEQMLPVIKACGGRTFFLFTSHEALNWMAEHIHSRVDFPILVQGSESKAILLAKFRSLGNAILLGTATFWEGVDVKGEALFCVIIDKLPFMNPNDPLTQGRMARFAQLGQSGFDVYTLPAAVIALKQGVGRLIRDVSDRGIVVIADPRLTGRGYGQVMMASLPPFKKTRELNKVLEFAEELL
jgi:ATP-dependent DNA helicase DinG